MAVEDTAMEKFSVAIFMLPASGRVTWSKAWDEQLYCKSASYSECILKHAETPARMDTNYIRTDFFFSPNHFIKLPGIFLY